MKTKVLITLNADGEQKSKTLSSTPIVVGSCQTADYKVPSNLASKRHFLINANGTNIEIKDLKSKTGTYINKRKISPNCWVFLEPTDTITLGHTTEIYLTIKALKKENKILKFVNTTNTPSTHQMGPPPLPLPHLDQKKEVFNSQVLFSDSDAAININPQLKSVFIPKEGDNKNLEYIMRKKNLERKYREEEEKLSKGISKLKKRLEDLSRQKKTLDAKVEYKKINKRDIEIIIQKRQRSLKELDQEKSVLIKSIETSSKQKQALQEDISSLLEEKNLILRETETYLREKEKLLEDATIKMTDKMDNSFKETIAVINDSYRESKQLIVNSLNKSTKLIDTNLKDSKRTIHNSITESVTLISNSLSESKGTIEKTIKESKNSSNYIHDSINTMSTLIQESYKESTLLINDSYKKSFAFHNDNFQEFYSLTEKLSQEVENRKAEKEKIDFEIDEKKIYLQKLESDSIEETEQRLADAQRKSDLIIMQTEDLKKKKISKADKDIEEKFSIIEKEIENKKAKAYKALSDYKTQELKKADQIKKESLQKIDYLKREAISEVVQSLHTLIVPLIKKESSSEGEVVNLSLEKIERIVTHCMDKKQQSARAMVAAVHYSGYRKKNKFKLYKVVLVTSAFLFCFKVILNMNPRLKSYLYEKSASLLKVEQSTGDLFRKQLEKERVGDPLYQPKRTSDYKASFTENVIYTKDFSQIWESNEMQSKWGVVADELMVSKMLLEDKDVKYVLDHEIKLINNLEEKRQFLTIKDRKAKLREMFALESEGEKAIRKLVKTEKNFQMLLDAREKTFKLVSKKYFK